jgi:hypothetical protein
MSKIFRKALAGLGQGLAIAGQVSFADAIAARREQRIARIQQEYAREIEDLRNTRQIESEARGLANQKELLREQARLNPGEPKPQYDFVTQEIPVLDQKGQPVMEAIPTMSEDGKQTFFVNVPKMRKVSVPANKFTGQIQPVDDGSVLDIGDEKVRAMFGGSQQPAAAPVAPGQAPPSIARPVAGQPAAPSVGTAGRAPTPEEIQAIRAASSRGSAAMPPMGAFDRARLEQARLDTLNKQNKVTVQNPFDRLAINVR